MTNSINTNIAAYFAQANINNASNLSTSSVGRLSSGNRIIQASDDVAALSTGTSLQTQVNALRTALTNASQGTSLLQVADGGLAQIQSILQQQQSLALQAGSGALTNTDRGFLNQQFQALTDQIDTLTSSTTFNSVKLIDGSIATGGSTNPLQALADASGVTTQAVVDGFTASTSITAVTLADSGATGNLTDTAFIGDLSKGVFSVTASATANNFIVTYTINGKTYAGTIDTGSTGGALVLNNVEADADSSSTGEISFTVATGDQSAAVDLASAGAIYTALTAAFADATAYAVRTVGVTLAEDANGNEIPNSGILATDTNGTLLQGFNGSDVTVQSTKFNGLTLPPISNFSATGFGTNTVFSVKVNGVTYSTDDSFTRTGGTTVSGTNFGNGNGIVRMYQNGDTDSLEYVQLDLSGLAANALLTTEANVDSLVDAINGILGSGGAAGGLSFQLGTTTSSSVAVNIGDASSASLFGGVTLDISTQEGAEEANLAVTEAISTLSSLRANVGSLQSRFNFASAALQSALQNQDAARSQLLDTDIAAESTSYATQQVKLQAGISVLAQANQQLQALLKLIG